MRARHLCVVLALLPVMIAASAPSGARHPHDGSLPLPSPTAALPPGYQSTLTPTQTPSVPPSATEAAGVTLAPTQTASETPSDTATAIAVSPTAAAVVSGTATAATTVTVSVVVTEAPASATAVSLAPAATATPTMTASPTATPTAAHRPSPTPTPVHRVAPLPTATPRPAPRHKAARHHATSRHRRTTVTRRRHGAVSSRHKAVTRSRATPRAPHRPAPRRVAPGPPLQALTVLAQPRAVGKNGLVTIHVQVNTQAQLAVVTLYGPGLTQQRWVTAPRKGISLIRLRALAPAGCRGSVVARVYVTATGNGRAMTRATTFTVGCAPARVSTARKPVRP